MEHATKKNYGGIPVRPLGNTGLEASIIGLGGAHLAQPQIEQSESLRIIQTAIDEGITFLDNAWDYYEGEAERRMGLGIQGPTPVEPVARRRILEHGVGHRHIVLHLRAGDRGGTDGR